MSFIGKPHISGSVLVWDGEKLLSERKLVDLQEAYQNSRFVQLADTICFIGDPLIAEPKLELIHTSPYEDDEGLRLTTDPNAGATCWKAITAFDKNENKVFEVEIDTNSSIVAVTSYDTDGNSGYQFLNEIGTFIALDTNNDPSILRIQKADQGYIDFGGDNQNTVLRIDTSLSEPKVMIGSYGTNNALTVNGMDITPYSGSVIVPLGSTDNHTLINFIELLDNDQYAMANVDVFATTLEMSSHDLMVNSSWKYFLSMNKKDNEVSVAGITEIDHQQISGSLAVDVSDNWDIELSSNGILFVNGNGANHKLAFGALITKFSVLDISTGNIIK